MLLGSRKTKAPVKYIKENRTNFLWLKGQIDP